MALQRAWRKLAEIQKQHKLLREEHLVVLADFYSIRRETTREQELKQIINIVSY